ncbi:alginate export family protein [Muricauda oceani]|uniref:Alginate export family protein n=1 Tax=Flagellimonas oceani TaxID=2698672 RepID=A0A6G7J0B4_9FLAO|nr:alginate export family protein [Allomuricauda oceani]MBW8243703.1 alginate export family protein [Allomuricauda oceani]QII43937.1 alginate export family protein [Allomuricauda oceani]
MRFNEDYSALEKDSLGNWYHRLKYKSIGKKAYVSFGGDFRVQYLLMDNEGWNPDLRDDDGFMLTRWLLHADLHLSGNVRVYAELQSALANSRDILLPVEENPLKLHQLFIDYQPFSEIAITFRLGRQEVSYGSTRLISLRDSPNTRRSFDGIKAIYNGGDIKTDMFYLHAVVDKVGIFDDTSSPDLRLWGIFSDMATAKKELHFNFYYLGFYNNNALFYDGAGMEKRHTLAARIFKDRGSWWYDLEGGYQFGSIDSRSISAWSIALATSYHFKSIKYTPEIGIKADLISGDKDNMDNSQQTLNTMFGPGAYFGMAAAIAPSNLMDIHPNVKLFLSEKTMFACDYAFLWRYSTGEGIYRPNMTPFFERNDASSRYIGSQVSGVFSYRANKHVSLLMGMSWFDSGAYLKEVSTGENIVFGFVVAQFKF